MKKITILAVAVVAISAASCRKERTCECTVISGTSSATITYKADNQKKTYFRKETLCYKYTETETYAGVSTVTEYDCKLK